MKVRIAIIFQFSSDKIGNITFQNTTKQYFRLEVTIFASLFNTFNVYFHNLQSLINEVLVQLGFEGWLRVENKKEVGQEERIS